MRAFHIYKRRFCYPSALSYGMQRKLSVAMACMSNREILLFDEPTTGLDPKSRHHMWNLLQDMKFPHRTILIATQLMEDVDAIADRICIMGDGVVHTYGVLPYLQQIYKTGKITSSQGSCKTKPVQLQREVDRSV